MASEDSDPSLEQILIEFTKLDSLFKKLMLSVNWDDEWNEEHKDSENMLCFRKLYLLIDIIDFIIYKTQELIILVEKDNTENAHFWELAWMMISLTKLGASMVMNYYDSNFDDLEIQKPIVCQKIIEIMHFSIHFLKPSLEEALWEDFKNIVGNYLLKFVEFSFKRTDFDPEFAIHEYRLGLLSIFHNSHQNQQTEKEMMSLWLPLEQEIITAFNVYDSEELDYFRFIFDSLKISECIKKFEMPNDAGSDTDYYQIISTEDISTINKIISS